MLLRWTFTGSQEGELEWDSSRWLLVIKAHTQCDISIAHAAKIFQLRSTDDCSELCALRMGICTVLLSSPVM